MASRDVAEVLAEAYELADSHLAVLARMGATGAMLPRDVMALSVFLPVIQSRDRLERKIRRLSKQARRIEAAVAKVPQGTPVPSGPRLVGLSDADWSRARQSMVCISVAGDN